MTTKLLNHRQARSSESLSRFDFKIIYRPRTARGKLDALTRRSGDLPKAGGKRLLYQSQIILKTENIKNLPKTKPSIYANEIIKTQLESLFEKAYTTDPFPGHVPNDLRTGVRQRKNISLSLCTEIDGRLCYDIRLFVPESEALQLYLLQAYHDSLVGSHQGKTKTFELLSRKYYLSGMRHYVEQFVTNCHTCSRIKTSCYAPYGVLKPLPVPARPWQDIS
jgi:hypothetical protein